MHLGGEKEVDFIFLIPGSNFSLPFIASWSNTIDYLHENKYTFTYCFSSTSIVQEVRNNLLSRNPGSYSNEYNKNAIFGNVYKCKKVIFIDSDIVWGKEDIHKILMSEFPVTVGAYQLADGRLSVGYRTQLDFGYLVNKQFLKEQKTPFSVDFAGLGFTAVDFDVLKKLNFPFFDTTYKMLEDETFMLEGEDAYFFRKIKELGYPIVCDPSLNIGHFKSMILSNKE